MRKFLVPIILIAFSLMAMKADKAAYQIYNIKGKKVSYAKLFKQAMGADVVLFGELHNNPICHWLQLELTADLFKEKGNQLVLGAEMFERDGQLILDEYIDGEISTRSFESQARLWPNYETDYKPLIEFAKENSIPFIPAFSSSMELCLRDIIPIINRTSRIRIFPIISPCIKILQAFRTLTLTGSTQKLHTKHTNTTQSCLSW